MKKILLNILLILVIFGGSSTFAAPTNNIIISEVQYDPIGHENRGEWFELYNPTSGTIDIGGWTIEEEQTLTSGPFMGQPRTFTFSTGTTIPAGGYLLVVNSIADFNTNGLGTLGTAPLDTISYVEMMYGSGCNHISSLGCLQLNNGTNATHIDYLLLKDNNSNNIDETRWGDYGHTSPANSNTSVCRITSDDTDSASDWMSNCTPTPGSQPIVGFLIFNPYITLQGLLNINLEVHNTYNDAGAIYTDSRGTGLATVSGSVNTGSLGTYILEYLHTDLSGNIAESVFRSVTVNDQTPPVVTLIGPASQTIPLGSVHVDQGASRSDNLDGSGTNVTVSGAVNSSLIGTYILQYTYTDTSGNTGNTVSRSVTVTDQTPPVVTLIGPASQTIPLGSVHVDQGASRSDNLDGSGTNVTVSGTVNSSLIGTYILQYTYTDTSGNTGNTVSRSVTVADQTPPVVNTGSTGVSGGGGGGYSPTTKDNCPNGDYTYSYYDNQCGQAPIDEIVPNPNDIYNGSIINGYCHTRKADAYITNHKNYISSEEFKKALTFLYAYDMTIFNDIDTFQPTSYLTRQQAAKIFSNFAMNVLCREPDTSLQPSYSDIDNTNETLQPYIIKAYQLGLMKGGDDGKFRPYANISKAAFNAVLIRMILKSYLPENSTVRYSEYNKVATHLNIIKKGASTTPISRKDASLMLFRAYKDQLFSLQNIDYESFVLQNRGQFIP